MIGDLEKENFDLKIRIYHLEEEIIAKYGTRENWERVSFFCFFLLSSVRLM